MNTKIIKAGLAEYDQIKVDSYVDYLVKTESAKNKDGSLKNPWFKYKNDTNLVGYFKKVAPAELMTFEEQFAELIGQLGFVRE